MYILGKDQEAKSGICSQCGGLVVQRVDDTPEGVKKRLRIFKEETLPIINYYQKQDKLIKIDGDQSIEKVFQSIVPKVESLEH